MKKALITSYFLLITSLLVAQNRFGNEWINYGQSYYKISVGQTGLYRLTYSDLQKAGFPLSTVDATTVQLFFRGQEQAIFVNGEADKKIDSQDFIEFYGQRNDGTLDSALYIPNSAQPHKVFNLYSDTTAYFLTWRLDGQAGRRMNFYQEANTTNLPAEAYHRENLLLLNVFAQNYTGMSDGQIYPLGSPEGTQLTHYDVGEGWSGPAIGKNSLNTKELVIENAIAAGQKPELEVHLMGRDHRMHHVELMIGSNATISRTIETARFDFFEPYLSKKTLEFGDLSSGKLFVTTASRGREITQTDDRYSTTYYRLKYSQRFDFQGKIEKRFYLNVNNAARSYIEIPNTPADVRLFDLTDPNNVQRIGTTIENNSLKTIVRQTNVERTLWATRQTLSVGNIEKVTFRNIDPTKHNYLVVTHKNLYNAAKSYAAHRATTGYDTLVVTTDLLVNQFNFGEFSPLAIRRFTQFMADRGNPRFMFLIGKTQQVNFSRNLPNRRDIDMVPTFGWPGGDNMFSHGLKGLPNFVPAFAVGRLWTDKPQTVLDYLDKVKQHEATPMNALWRKNILHLSGGISPNELTQFKKNLDEFKTKAQRQYFGARVMTISKKTDEAVEYIGVSSELNKGVGLITMFGHSSLSVADIDIGFVSDDVQGYRNKGKYPLIYANGCVLGNFTHGDPTYPVDWVGAKDRGAILFLAHANTAFTSTLKQYGDVFYDVFLGDSANVGRPFGDVHQRIIQRYLKENPNSNNHIANAQELVLQGDPAVVMFPAKSPDYALNQQNISVFGKNGTTANALSDSLDIKILVSNLGMFRNLKVPVKLVRTGKDGAVQSYNFTLPQVAYQDSLTMRIPNDRTQSGNNKFEISIDPNNNIAEISEQNNVASIEANIPALGAYPIMPAEYAIATTADNGGVPTVTLVAQQVENTTQNYVAEVDTTARFDSPFKKSLTISAAQLPTWKVSLLPRDSTVYYWRVRYADRPANDENRWAESSFTYIRNLQEGWTQRQAAQFSKNTLADLKLATTTSPTWIFDKNNVSIKAVLAGNSVGAFNEGFSKNQLIINDLLLVSNGGCASYDQANNWRRDNNIIVTALRRDNLQAYSVMPIYNCGNPPYATNTLPDRLIINEKLLEKWLDAVPAGDWVVMMTSGNVAFDSWAASTKAKLKEFGVSDARLAEIRSGRPYLFIGQKGAKQLATELLTDPTDLAPSLRTMNLDNFTLQSTKGNGQIESSLIGPASRWGMIKNTVAAVSIQQYLFDIVGLDLQLNKTVLLQNQTTNTLDLSKIDAARYPYLQLKLKLKNTDVTTINPAQLRNWLVSYTGVPEGAVFSTSATAADYQEGENVNVNVGFKNISNTAFADSVLVQQTLYLANGTVQNSQRKIKKLQPNEEASFAINFSTVGRTGNNRLIVNFNPRQQAEQNFGNNTVNIPLNVVQDKIPPVMEVAFDGQRIKDGDVVSANPMILVQLKDENRTLFKRDTLGIDVFLQMPNQTTFRRISFSSNVLKFTSADNQNIAKVEYRPNALPDGIYTLRVQGADASGNRTGVYTVTFKIINEQKILNVAAYPNPATDILAITFAVSGKDAPTNANISLTDAAGRLVRVVSQPVRLGTNVWYVPNIQTLAVGTYQYRIVVTKNGQEINPDGEAKLSGKIVVGR